MAETNTTTKDPELVAAEREAALAKARKEKAEAELATTKAQLTPLTDQSKITSPSGDVTSTTDQAGFVETQMLAQEAAREIAGQLKTRLIKAKVKTLIIYNNIEIASLSALAAVLEQLEQLAREFDEQEANTDQVLADATLIMEESAAAVPPAFAELVSSLILVPSIATGVVKSVAELVNLFRTTTEFKRQAVTVTEDMIVSYLVNKFGEDVTVYYPAFFPPNVIDTSGTPGFAAALKKLDENRLAAQSRIAELESMATNLTTKMSTTPSGSQEKFKSAINAINEVKSKLQVLNTVVEQLTASLQTPDVTTKEKPISQLIRAERLASIMKGEGAFTLRLAVTANGTTMIRKNLFTSAGVQHSAGVSLVYQLFDLTGRVVNADALQYYFEFKSADEVRALINKHISKDS